MKVTFVLGGLRRRGGAEGQSRAPRRRRAAPRPRRADRRVRCRRDRPRRPPAARSEPHEHTEHGVPRRTPTTGCATPTPPVLAHLVGRAGVGTTRRCASGLPGRRALQVRDGVAAAADRRVGTLVAYALFLLHPAPPGRDYAATVAGNRIVGHLADDGFDSRPRPDDEYRAARGGPRRRLAGRRQRLPRPRADPGQPRREPARLLRRHRPATRSSRSASATCAPVPTCPTSCRAATTAAPGARTRQCVLLHRARRGVPPVPGLAAPARHARPPTTCWCSRSRTSGSS